MSAVRIAWPLALWGTGAKAKKYSMLSAKPVKLPRGLTRPVAFAFCDSSQLT